MAAAQNTTADSSDNGQLAEAGSKHKRKREDSDAERKYGLDLDILECPICLEPLSPPVYQCVNGHTTCSACCKKLVNKRCPTCSLPTGSNRCTAIEKILESLLVSCKYAPQGCQEMLKQSELDFHEEEECLFEPFRCPVPECIYEGSKVGFSVHLVEKHKVPRVELDYISGVVGFRMEASDRFVMVKVRDENSDEDHLLLVHREAHELLGDVFFCTAFQGFSCKSYGLKVVLCFCPWLSHSMAGASALDLRSMNEYWNADFLLLPYTKRLAPDPNRPVEVIFSLSREDDLRT